MPYAVITGASQGMGKVFTDMLLLHGFDVAVSARNQAKLLANEQEWKQKYPEARIVVFPADLSVKEQVYAFADKVLEQFPEIDILINNAGNFEPGVLAEEPEGLLEEMIGVNLYIAYRLTRRILPVMKQHRKGHIFNMCSVASLKAYPRGGSYGISKYAVFGFTENLREELRPHNIKVTGICPGATYTPSWENSGEDADRMMESGDIADMIWRMYTLSPQANVETIIMRPVKGDL